MPEPAQQFDEGVLVFGWRHQAFPESSGPLASEN
jgi:hypothetical protein